MECKLDKLISFVSLDSNKAYSRWALFGQSLTERRPALLLIQTLVLPCARSNSSVGKLGFLL